MSATIELESEALEPGGVLRGRVRWQSPERPPPLELRLFWHTRGRGTEELEVVEARSLSVSPGVGGSFEFALPVGFRRELAGMRNAQLQLAKERALLQETELELADTRCDAGWRADHPELVERLWRESPHAAGVDPATDRELRQLRARRAHDCWDRLDSIAAPTLVCGGSHDGGAPLDRSRARQTSATGRSQPPAPCLSIRLRSVPASEE